MSGRRILATGTSGIIDSALDRAFYIQFQNTYNYSNMTMVICFCHIHVNLNNGFSWILDSLFRGNDSCGGSSFYFKKI